MNSRMFQESVHPSMVAEQPPISAGGVQAFVWPNPPGEAYPTAAPQSGPQLGDIVGVNGKEKSVRLISFFPEESLANVQFAPGSSALPLRFHQFRSLTLTAPVAPLLHLARNAQNLLTFTIALNNGEELQGETLGKVDTPYGLFLFPPAGRDGSALRQFLPRAAFKSVRLRPGGLNDRPDTSPHASLELVARDLAVEEELGPDGSLARAGTEEALIAAIDRQARMPLMRIGETLMSLGMITEAQLNDALARQREDRSVSLGEVLVNMGAVTRADLQAGLARKMGHPLVDLDVFQPTVDALRKISLPVARRLQLVPLMVHNGRLIVALEDPADSRASIAEAEFSAQMKVLPVQAQSTDIEQVLLSAYAKVGVTGERTASRDDPSRNEAGDPLETRDLVKTLEQEGRQPEDEDVPIEQSDNSLVRMINRMILEAHKDGVSDIHIESYPGREKIRIRFRKDGRLRTYLELPPNYRNAMIARIKIMCDLDISERRKPQDGKINFAKFSPEHRIELRVATIPTNNGLEDVVMRILSSSKPIPLDSLGFSPHNLAELKRAVERPYGMVLCVGPTGSGKTTTLHSALAHVNVAERKIWTAEDPIEITQAGLRQVQINPRIDWTFAKALRAFLRADPDVIMVGEIRDSETAQMAVEASLTGHLVLSTLHTNSAPETVTRLLDMGMDPFNFADSLLAVLAQRLVRRLCPKCLTSRPATEEEVDELLSDYMHAYGDGATHDARFTVLADWIERYGKDGQLQKYHSPGCPHCDQTGFRGRAGVHELMVISRDMRRLIQTGSRAEALQETALREGMRTLRQDGIEKVLEGRTTIEEVRATSNA